MSGLDDVCEIDIIAFANFRDIRIKSWLKTAIAEPSHDFNEPFDIAWGIGTPIGNTEILQIGVQPLFNNPCFPNEKNLRFHSMHNK